MQECIVSLSPRSSARAHVRGGACWWVKERRGTHAGAALANFGMQRSRPLHCWPKLPRHCCVWGCVVQDLERTMVPVQSL